MAIIRIFADIEWRCHRASQGENWIAECDVLGLTVQSSRYSELAEDIGDTLDLLFSDLFTGDELDQFLTAHGWTRTHEAFEGEPSDAVFDVPFELLVAARDGSTANLH